MSEHEKAKCPWRQKNGWCSAWMCKCIRLVPDEKPWRMSAQLAREIEEEQ